MKRSLRKFFFPILDFKRKEKKRMPRSQRQKSSRRASRRYRRSSSRRYRGPSSSPSENDQNPPSIQRPPRVSSRILNQVSDEVKLNLYNASLIAQGYQPPPGQAISESNLLIARLMFRESHYIPIGAHINIPKGKVVKIKDNDIITLAFHMEDEILTKNSTRSVRAGLIRTEPGSDPEYVTDTLPAKTFFTHDGRSDRKKLDMDFDLLSFYDDNFPPL